MHLSLWLFLILLTPFRVRIRFSIRRLPRELNIERFHISVRSTPKWHPQWHPIAVASARCPCNPLCYPRHENRVHEGKWKRGRRNQWKGFLGTGWTWPLHSRTRSRTRLTPSGRFCTISTSTLGSDKLRYQLRKSRKLQGETTSSRFHQTRFTFYLRDNMSDSIE